MSSPPLDTQGALEVFLRHRTSLFRVALRITRDPARAEDCVQDAWLRWQLTDRDRVVNPPAFLTTTVRHLAINVVQSAAHRHEIPSDSLPAELAGRGQDPVGHAEQSAVVAEIVRLLMARLSPAQLAAYLLRKGFDYSYPEIARLLRTTIPNARQLIRRAQDRVVAGHDRPVGRASHRRLVAAFLDAARAGDLTGLERALTQRECQLLAA